jgi:Na+/phosphate symporter
VKKWFEHLCWKYKHLEARVSFYALFLAGIALAFLIGMATIENLHLPGESLARNATVRVMLIGHVLVTMIGLLLFELMLPASDPYSKFEN